MPTSGGVSGLAVGMSAAGGLLVWSAIRNVSPVDTLKEVLGRPSTRTPISTPFASTTSGVRSYFGTSTPAGGGVAGTADAGRLVAEARKLIGTPYVWASASASGVDCSGLVILCLKRMGVPDVPRFTTATFGSWASKRSARRLKPNEFAAGDVILRTGHMGIAISSTRMIHSPRVGSKVQEADIYNRSTWWGWRLWGNAKESFSSE